MNTSLVIVTPAALRAEAGACLAALGWGAQNYLVDLVTEATESATVFALRATVPTDSMNALRDELAAYPALDGTVMIVARPDCERMGHFGGVLAEHGLTRIAPPYVD